MSPNAWGAGLSSTADDVSSDVTSSLRNPFSSGVGEMINTFSMSAYKVGLKVNPNEQDPRVPVLSWSTCAYTMQSIGTLSPGRLAYRSSADWQVTPDQE